MKKVDLRDSIISFLMESKANNSFMRGLIKFYLKNFPIYFNGFWYFLNESNYGLVPQILSGNFEEHNFSVIKKILKKGDVAVDVGAHIGLYSLFFSELVGEKGEVHSFEPDNNNLKLLLKNIRLNRLDNIYPQKIAIADNKGTAKFYLSSKTNWDHRLINPPGEKRKFLKVKKDKLDNIFRNKKIDFVKIDVQGFEGKCLNGMVNLIKKSKDFVLFIEFWPKGLKEAGTKPERFLKNIESLGFKIYEVNGKGETLVSLKDMKMFLDLNEYDHADLLCIKKGS